MDMHPSYRTYHGVSRHPDDHVLLAHALVAAFDAIEELGLSVPAGHERPSRVGGAWNPVVLADLEGRLRRERIDPVETILWSVRGPVRRIERQRPLPAGASPRWVGGSVRDRRLPVADAIGYSDYLRDRVAAHSTKALTRSLTPYDVVTCRGLPDSCSSRVLASECGNGRHSLIGPRHHARRVAWASAPVDRLAYQASGSVALLGGPRVRSREPYTA